MNFKDIMSSMNAYSNLELKSITDVCRKLNLEFDHDDVLSDSRLLINKDDRVEIVINKITDDYYSVSLQTDDKFYKCDQLDGLIKLLEDKFKK